MRETTEIAGYHAHVYFDDGARDLADRLRTTLGERFDVELGRRHDRPVGPHPKAMFQVAFGTETFAKIVPWLMLNREGLSVLVHPRTGDEVADHSVNPLWLGEPLPLDIEFLRVHGG
jgi:DOPA 4,5-dioxygenase